MPRTVFLRARWQHINRMPTFVYDDLGRISDVGSNTVPQDTDLWQPGSGGKINFIKMVREVTGLGLREAKDVADALEKPNAVVELVIPDMPSEGPPTNYRGDILRNYGSAEALSPWVYLDSTDRLPAPLKALLDEYRKLGSRREAGEKGGRHFKEWSLAVDGYVTRVGFRPGIARPDALGPRTYNVMRDLSLQPPKDEDGNPRWQFQYIFDLLQAARVLACADGKSHDRACADVGAILLHVLTEHTDGQAPPTSKLTSIELLIHEAARRLLA